MGEWAEQTDGGKAANKNVATGVSAGAVGGGEARTAVLSGHQWARRFVTTAFLRWSSRVACSAVVAPELDCIKWREFGSQPVP